MRRSKRLRGYGRHGLSGLIPRLAALRVEGADPGATPGQVLAEHREDGDVTKRPALAARQASPQRCLLDEAELARDAEARLVARLDPDLDPVHLADLEARARQRGRRLGHDPLPRRARAHPVADLEPARPDAGMKPGAAEQLGFVGGEDPVREVLAGDEAGAEGLDELDLLLERLRLVERPRHPRLQVLEARVDRVLQQRRVARLVAADDEPLRLDPVRSGPPLPAHAMRPTRTQPLCPPRPIAFDSATSTCTSRASFGT